MEKETNIFTFINQIQNKRRVVEYNPKIAPAYVLSLFLSMNKDYLKKVNEINKYQFVLSDKAIYEYYMATIPMGITYSKFVKKRDDSKQIERLEKLKNQYPEMSTRECKMLLSFIEKKGGKK